MSNGRVRACSGIFKDSEKGKTPGDYDHNESYIFTISVPGASNISINFKSFCTEKDNDYLQIYNGKDTFAPKLGPRYSGSTNPGLVRSTDSFITFFFKSDKNIACSGWEATWSATMRVITAPSLTLQSAPKCKQQSLSLLLGRAFPCDSVKPGSFVLSGPISSAVSTVTPVNCTGGNSATYNLQLTNALNMSGTYTLEATLFFKDYCDSIWTLKSKTSFTISDCPLMVQLTADKDTLCRGSCTWLRATVSGGTPSRYVYTWTPGSLSGAGPHLVCPTGATRYILRVTDGLSVPASDTVDLTVLAPPSAQPDTMVCYLSAPFKLRAIPAGGFWQGKGITDAANGIFSPAVSGGGTHKVWYQIGSCADTVLVTSTGIWNGDNLFCPNTPPSSLYHIYPTGGTWTGPKVTSNGIFNPDSAGTFKLTYTWKGCVSTKTVRVTQIWAKPFDTACESSTFHQLQFNPIGVFFNWFPGLTNSYYGTVNPSLMGGPGTKTIIFNARGCKDTTLLTLLPIDAGKTFDTICPAAGVHSLSGFRPLSGYSWTGRGISDTTKPEYNPGYFSSLGKTSFTDTLTIRNGRCADRKFLTLLPTQVGKRDTLFLCAQDTGIWLSKALTQFTPSGGTWSGKGITNAKGFFKPAASGYGTHLAFYSVNGCRDSLRICVRPKTGIQQDTAVCRTSGIFKLKVSLSGGYFYGTGISNSAQGLFNPAIALKGKNRIIYVSRFGCFDTVFVTVDTIPAMQWQLVPSAPCLKDTAYLLKALPGGGLFSGPGVSHPYFNPWKSGSGNKRLEYRITQGACTGLLQRDIVVADTLRVSFSGSSDSICPGSNVLITAQALGGNRFAYRYSWSNGLTGSNQAYFSPKNSTTIQVTVSDGCSKPDTATRLLFVHPNTWFNAKSSAPECFGLPGYLKLSMSQPGTYLYTWNTQPKQQGDSMRGLAGSRYLVSVMDVNSGCKKDTSLEIPGFRKLNAAFITNPPKGICLSNINPKMYFLDMSSGGTSGSWDFGDGSTEPYQPGNNPNHTYQTDTNRYRVQLIIRNDGGCADSAELNICVTDTVLLFVPSAFTPNKNGLNEVFLPTITGAREYQLDIYDRWGAKIFSSNNPNQGWDGMFMGKDCPSGCYAYSLHYKGRKTYRQVHSGLVHLIR